MKIVYLDLGAKVDMVVEFQTFFIKAIKDVLLPQSAGIPWNPKRSLAFSIAYF